MPVIMKDNVQYAYTTKGTVFHTLSNAEYEALPESEKMNGDVYCIPDREPVINPDQLWEKVGTGTLDIGSDLTDGVNQLNSSFSQLDGLTVYKNLTPQTSYADFDDGSTLPLISLTSNIDPIQDLHGYDYPWVGGAGKNKLNYDLWKTVPLTRCTAVWENNGVTLTSTGADAYTGCGNSKFFTKVAPNSVVTLCWEEDSNINGTNYIFVYDSNFSQISIHYINNSLSKSIRITTPANAAYIDFRFGVEVSGATISYKNIQLLFTYEITTFAPYSNICPISGWDEVNVTVADDVENPTVSNTYTIDLDGTRYGGTLDVVSGELTVTDEYIASYNGETLPSTWISDRDVYAEGTTPTTGAEVVYELATPQTYQFTPTQVNSLLGQNYISCDTGNITNIKYLGILNLS